MLPAAVGDFAGSSDIARLSRRRDAAWVPLYSALAVVRAAGDSCAGGIVLVVWPWRAGAPRAPTGPCAPCAHYLRLRLFFRRGRPRFAGAFSNAGAAAAPA